MLINISDRCNQKNSTFMNKCCRILCSTICSVNNFYQSCDNKICLLLINKALYSPGVAPLMRSSVKRTPMCTENGEMALQIAFTAPIQVTIVLLGEAIAGGVLPF